MVNNRPQLALVRGLPGSGKSTLARERFSGFRHLEADQYFVRDGVYQFDPYRLAEAHGWCQREAATALTGGEFATLANTFSRHWEMVFVTEAASARGESVVVTNTFSRHWEMEPYLRLHPSPTVIDLFDAGLSDAELAARNVHGVPETTIAAMRSRWEKL